METIHKRKNPKKKNNLNLSSPEGGAADFFSSHPAGSTSSSPRPFFLNFLLFSLTQPNSSPPPFDFFFSLFSLNCTASLRPPSHGLKLFFSHSPCHFRLSSIFNLQRTEPTTGAADLLLPLLLLAISRTHGSHSSFPTGLPSPS